MPMPVAVGVAVGMPVPAVVAVAELGCLDEVVVWVPYLGGGSVESTLARL